MRMLFPVPVGPDMDTLRGFPQFHHYYRSWDYSQPLHPDLMRNPRPARFLLPVALLPVPAWVHLRAMVNSERPVRECDRSTMQTAWDSKTASGRSSCGSGRSRTQPGPDMEVGQLEEARKPVGFIFQAQF